MTWRRMKQKKLILFILLAVIFIELFLLFKNKQAPKSISLEQYASEVLAKCSNTSHHQSCYDEEVPKLMDSPANLSMEQAFEVTRLVQEKDSSFPYCHVLGHNLSAKEVKKNPSKWKEIVSRCPSGMCSNGCIHGGFQEKFRAESLTDEQIEGVKPDLKSICEKRDNWNPTGLEQASCYHALGHLTMYLTAADIDKAVKLCQEIALKPDGRDFQQLCFDGVFMQIFQPLEPEDFALVSGKQPSKDDVVNFCSKFKGWQKGSCLSESWPLYRQELIDNPDELVKFCSRSENLQQDRCYLSLFYVLTAQFDFDTGKIKDYCLGLPKTRQGQCFANASSRFIETDYRNIDKSVSLCSDSGTQVNQETCFEELLKYSTYNFHVGSDEFDKLCHGLPNPWQGRCSGLTRS